MSADPLRPLGCLTFFAAALALLLAGCAFKTSARSTPTVLPPLDLGRTLTPPEVKKAATVDDLKASLRAMSQPRGCWAYTLRRELKVVGKPSKIYVAEFHPGKPEKERWKLLSFNGGPASEDQMKAFARKANKAAKSEPPIWQRALEFIEKYGNSTDLQVRADDDSVFFATLPIPKKNFLSRSFHIDRRTGDLVAIRDVTERAISVYSALGRVHLAYIDTQTELARQDPALPPFVTRRIMHWRMKWNLGEQEIQMIETFSGYRKVTCFDDRFQVIVHEPQIMDLPDL